MSGGNYVSEGSGVHSSSYVNPTYTSTSYANQPYTTTNYTTTSYVNQPTEYVTRTDYVSQPYTTSHVSGQGATYVSGGSGINKTSYETTYKAY